MNKFNIYCLSLKEFTFFKYLPSNIIPIVLGSNLGSGKYLNDVVGDNIRNYNKFFGELTGMYWVYKNELKKYTNDDWIGFCQHRRFFLDNIYEKNHKIKTNLFSKLLVKKNDQFEKNNTIMIKPTIHKQNIYDHFINNHSEKLLTEFFNILDNNNSTQFKKYLENNEYSICNMFITKPYIFKNYCEIVFPLLEKILSYCLKENLCVNGNVRLPVFLIERFTSYWFIKNAKVGYLSYAVLNKYFTSNLINNFYNTLKTPYSFKNFPTILNV